MIVNAVALRHVYGVWISTSRRVPAPEDSMSALLALVALLSTANAAPMVITLDSGGTVRGELAWYEYGGDCQISVTEGELMGSILVVPCDRLTRIERPLAAEPATDFAPVIATALQEEVVAEAPIAAAPPTAPALPALEDGPGLALPVEADAYAVPNAPVPLDARVTIDPALLDEHPEARVASPPRAPTVRVPPSSTGATVGW